VVFRSSNNLIYRRRRADGIWDDPLTLATLSSTGEYNFSISRDPDSGRMYVIWVGIPKIYYVEYDGAAWEPRVEWLDETADGIHSSYQYHRASSDIENKCLTILYATGTSSPYKLKVASLALPTQIDVSDVQVIQDEASMTAIRSTNDAVELSDQASLTAIRPADDCMAVHDSASLTAIRPADDCMAVHDSASLTAIRPAVDAVEAHDAASLTAVRVSEDGVQMQDEASLTAIWPASESMTSQDAASLTAIRSTNDAVELSDQASLTAIRSTNDAVELSDQASLTAVRPADDRIDTSEAVRIFGIRGEPEDLIAGLLQAHWTGELIAAQFAAGRDPRTVAAQGVLVRVYHVSTPPAVAKGLGYTHRELRHRLTIDIRSRDARNAYMAKEEALRILGEHRIGPWPGYDIILYDDGSDRGGGPGLSVWTIEITVTQLRKRVV